MASNNLHSEVADSERFSSPAVQFLHRALEVLLMCGTSDPICFILDEIPRWWWLDFDFWWLYSKFLLGWLDFWYDDIGWFGWLDVWWYSKFWFQFSMVKPVNRHVNLPFFYWWNASLARSAPTPYRYFFLRRTGVLTSHPLLRLVQLCQATSMHSKYWP